MALYVLNSIISDSENDSYLMLMKKIQIISLQKLCVTLPSDTARQEEQWRKCGSNTTIELQEYSVT